METAEQSSWIDGFICCLLIIAFDVELELNVFAMITMHRLDLQDISHMDAQHGKHEDIITLEWTLQSTLIRLTKAH